MIFISLAKMKKKPTEGDTSRAADMIDGLKRKGIKILGWYWTLGRYDAVLIFEAPNEKSAMQTVILFSNLVTVETMVAVPREDAVKLL